MKKKQKKGSLTVEAVISFTVFLMATLFMLYLVKMVLCMVILNNTTVETAKLVATSAYPISMLNEGQASIENKADALSPKSVGDMVKSTVSSSVVSNILGTNAGQTMKSGSISIVKDLIEGAAVQGLRGFAYNLKDSFVRWSAGKLIEWYSSDSGISFDMSKLNILVFKIPITSGEFSTTYTEAIQYGDSDEYSIRPGDDFGEADVVVCLEYPYEITVPFINKISVTLRATAIEHAWLNGTCSGAKKTEGFDLNNILTIHTVYIATGGYGNRYHRKGCFHLGAANSVTSLPVTDAIQKGFTPCKTCRPDDRSRDE